MERPKSGSSSRLKVIVTSVAFIASIATIIGLGVQLDSQKSQVTAQATQIAIQRTQIAQEAKQSDLLEQQLKTFAEVADNLDQLLGSS